MTTSSDRRQKERRAEEVDVDVDRRGPSDRRQEDRRGSQRVDLELWMEEVTTGAVYYRCAANIGEGGAYFDHALPYPLGTKLTLKFALPGDDRPIVARGEVVNTDTTTTGMGLRFVSFDEDGARRLHLFIEQLD